MIPFPKIQNPIFIILSLLGVIFVALAVVLFVPSSSPATPVITWSPESVTETISPGSSKVVNISFTSSKNLANVTVWVVPELDPFIQVQSETFNQITKGQANNLTLTFSAKQDSPLGAFDGTIHLKTTGKSSKTFAKPLPVTINIRVSTPQVVLSELVTALRENDMDTVLSKIEPTDKNRELFSRLNSRDLNEFANFFENAQPIKTTEAYRVYKSELKDNNGQIHSVEFIMIQDSSGEWIIAGL